MTVNIDDATSWGKLPAELQTLLREVHRGALDYPERARSWQSLQDYLQNGNFFMAKGELEKILERQDNLRQ
uniref:hypothetical protein n=1 Tax=Hafnia alvei TaxID=569 RepID=UPI00242D3A81|nr:hypothetical protein [Hafnia alvei]